MGIIAVVCDIFVTCHKLVSAINVICIHILKSNVKNVVPVKFTEKETIPLFLSRPHKV